MTMESFLRENYDSSNQTYDTRILDKLGFLQEIESKAIP
jgi:hypothetical protein